MSQSHGIAPLSLEGIASTMGTAAVPAAIAAILPGTLVVDLGLDNARGGGPYTFRCRMQEGALLRLAGVVSVEHTWCSCLWAGVILATLLASALLGVVAPAFGGGEVVVVPLALAFGLALALA